MDLKNAEISHVLNFATKQAQTIVGLAYVNLAICLLFLLVVVGLVAYVAYRFRYRPGDGEPVQVEGNSKLEVAWTVVPALLFTVLAVGTGLVMQEVNPPVGKRRPDVIVIGHQFWWEYQYPKLGVITANELYLPEGADLMLEIRGADVIHSFWVPDFGQKMDGIPGHPNNLFLKPLKKGLFLGQCSEYCGSQHAMMRILANVVSQREFGAWAGSQSKVPARPRGEISRHGQLLFMTK